MADPKNIRILREAEVLFAEKGFDGTSIRDIATAAEANVSMISYYFGSKEALMKEIIRERIHESVRLLNEVMADETTTPLEKIEAFVGRFIEHKIQNVCFTRILMTEQTMKRNEDFVEIITELRTTMARHLETLLKLAAQKGHIRKNIDVVLLTSTLIGTVNALVSNRDFYKSYHKISGTAEVTFNEDYNQIILQHTQSLLKYLLLHEK